MTSNSNVSNQPLWQHDLSKHTFEGVLMPSGSRGMNRQTSPGITSILSTVVVSLSAPTGTRLVLAQSTLPHELLQRVEDAHDRQFLAIFILTGFYHLLF
jgi:hypothetical protein